MDIGIDGYEDAVEIGRGGFGVVYRARQPKFNRTVAIKVLPPFGDDDAARQRFERECAALGSVSGHPQIVTVYDSGTTGDVRPYLSMAYLPKGSLADRLMRQGPVPWSEAVEMTIKVAGALESAHRAGIVHRDIKPENVLLSDFGEPQLADFGIARVSGGHETRSGVITASLVHAGPEVLAGQRPGPASDQYSLASTLYELIAGGPAFAQDTDETVAPMIARISTAAPPDLRPQGVPELVWRAITRAMAKEPTQRFGSVADFGRELQDAQREAGRPVTAMSVAGDLSGATVVVDGVATGPSPVPRRRGPIALVAAGVALVLVVGAVFVITRQQPTAQTGTSASGLLAPRTTSPVTEATPAITQPRAANTDISTAVLEPGRFGGLLLGSSEEEVIAAFGQPDVSTVQQNTGGEYRQMIWTRKIGTEFLSVTLHFKSSTRYSPGLTNWIVSGPGPVTSKGIQIGDDQDAAEAAHGPSAFGLIQIDEPEGRLMISVNERKVAVFLGGDPEAINQP